MNSDRQRQMAVALTYQAGSSAPRVIGQGRGLLAEMIIERARGGRYLRA